ncbi:metal ABC transporter solute-binding protein, Zn/Mn family [Bacteroides sp. 519]|uniref:metal ABC transporter solute-binding protein, Zn/Mn family n=1 Tax=Bacteroides sp. 519 TaxID=2302937 RepID=UPI0013D1FF0A|nr:zinc ABC transporter substrate-binding protein [Bacteroides sp. 519]NDV57591.1 zinc ABC transporter substrate-binding protein [Bacteroides sp. 519]
MKKLLLFVTLIALFTACGSRAKKESDERTITVTIEPLRYFTEAIVGDKFSVISMVPKGVSPETYDPTPRQLVDLGKSEVYFRIGHIGFEVSWMDRLLQNNPHLLVFDMSKGVNLIRGTGHHHGDHYHAGGVEPHIWNSAVNARIIARNILTALIKIDRNNEAYYVQRYEELIKKIDETDQTVQCILKENADTAFMIYHPALTYFAHEYSLHQICIEEDGKEPSAAHLKNLIEISKFEHVRVIFVQPEFDERNAEMIAQQTDTKIIPINPLSYDWEKEMIHIAQSLKHE